MLRFLQKGFEMDSFLDTNVVINYSLYNSENSGGLFLKCFEYINSKREKFFVCYRVLRELKSVSKKLTLMRLEVVEKLKNKDYVFGSLDKEGIFGKRDLIKIKKIYLKRSGEDIKKVQEEFIEVGDIMFNRITFFLEKLVLEFVISEDKIDKGLVSILREFIDNYADCEVLASAILFQEERELFLFVTADRDFAPNDYDFVKDDDRLDGYKFPRLKNLLFD